LERVRYFASRRPDVIVWDGYVTPEDRLALIAASDGYVSLHRSEGFGLTIAEAMSLGTPVIATAYSGNMDFMQASDSHLVDFRYVSIPRGAEPYPPTARWADPDLDQAADHMRQVVGDPVRAKEMADRAKLRILSERSPERAGDSMLSRLEKVHNSHVARSEPETDPIIGPPADPGQLASQLRTALEHARPWAGRLARVARTYRSHNR